MRHVKLLAIDPGKTGALAWKTNDGAFEDRNMPDTPHGIASLIRELDPDQVVIERVGFHIQGNNASASAKFARHVGFLHGVLVTMGIPFVEVLPSKWQKELCGTLPKDKPARKRAIQAFVENRIGATVTLRNADAVAILLWGLKA